VLVSNPPYVPRTDQAGLQREVRDYEPHVALFAGPTGIEVYEKLVVEARRVLRLRGWLLLELGYNSVGPVSDLLGTDWQEIEILADLAGLPRVLAARLAR
jgi:release factor glutamine methyltransferase